MSAVTKKLLLAATTKLAKSTSTIKATKATTTTLLSTSAAIAPAPTTHAESLLLSSPAAAAAVCNPKRRGRMVATAKIMSYHNLIAMLTLLLCGLATVNGLKCYMCGQYNEGVGSITPCLNYSDQYGDVYLKECSKKSEKFCVKYVSELSTVRDCATECIEKEIWETQTYCCNTDGCNGSSALQASKVLLLLPLVYVLLNVVLETLKVRR